MVSYLNLLTPAGFVFHFPFFDPFYGFLLINRFIFLFFVEGMHEHTVKTELNGISEIRFAYVVGISKPAANKNL